MPMHFMRVLTFDSNEKSVRGSNVEILELIISTNPSSFISTPKKQIRVEALFKENKPSSRYRNPSSAELGFVSRT